LNSSAFLLVAPAEFCLLIFVFAPAILDPLSSILDLGAMNRAPTAAVAY
jgi:hypothetical protein